MKPTSQRAARPPYFVFLEKRGSWQLLSGSGTPLTAPRVVDGAAAVKWRRDALALAKARGARVMSAGEWVGRVGECGTFARFAGSMPKGGTP